MKIKVILAACILLLSTSANALLIDLSGETADGNAFNIFTVNNINTAAVTDITFNFIYDAGDNGSNFSWGSELGVQVGHIPTGLFGQIGTQDGGCAAFSVFCEFDLMWDDFGGVFTASGTISLGTILDGSGDWEVLIADSFDDSGIDGRFLDGSFISINQVSQVPVPATLLLFGLGIAGISLTRRHV